MKTARGIYYRLWESEYVHTIGNIRFYFSSRMHRDKFIASYQAEINRFNTALNKVYKNQFAISGDYLAMIRHYTKIEKRGFYLEMNGVKITCLEDLAFDMTANYKMKLDA